METRYEKRGYLLEDFRLFHLQDARGVKTEYHYHEFCKLLLVLSGSGSYTVEGLRYPLSPGDVVLLGSNSVHKSEFEPGRPYERIIVYISPDLLRRASMGDCALEECFSGETGSVLRLREGAFQKVLSPASELEQELSQRRYGSSIVSTGLLLRLLVEIGRCRDDRIGQWAKPQSPKSPVIQTLLQYLDQNLDQPLSIDELADRCFTSKFHLMRLFREETGSTIHNYITERRLFLARDLMAQGIPSTKACYQAGFGSYSSFSRAYSKLFGITPTGRPGKEHTETLDE